MRRGKSPASRRHTGAAPSHSSKSVVLDDDGNAPNPYARFAEWVDERVHGANHSASDGFEHQVEVLAWTGLVEAMLTKFASQGAQVDKQVRVHDGSVNIVISGLSRKDIPAVSKNTRLWLPTGCSFQVGDPNDDAEHANGGVARLPDNQHTYFIKVTERAQANLERRREMSQRTRTYDITGMIGALIGGVLLCAMLYKHTEGHRDPFNALASVASAALGGD